MTYRTPLERGGQVLRIRGQTAPKNCSRKILPMVTCTDQVIRLNCELRTQHEAPTANIFNYFGWALKTSLLTIVSFGTFMFPIFFAYKNKLIGHKPIIKLFLPQHVVPFLFK